MVEKGKKEADAQKPSTAQTLEDITLKDIKLDIGDTGQVSSGENQKKSLEQLQLEDRKMLYQLISDLAPLVKDYFLRKIEAEKPKFTTSLWVLGSLVAIIVISTGVLTYQGHISGESFTFLMGVVIGYIMTHLRTMFVIQEE